VSFVAGRISKYILLAPLISTYVGWLEPLTLIDCKGISSRNKNPCEKIMVKDVGSGTIVFESLISMETAEISPLIGVPKENIKLGFWSAYTKFPEITIPTKQSMVNIFFMHYLLHQDYLL
jgi:hypothetical protein